MKIEWILLSSRVFLVDENHHSNTPARFIDFTVSSLHWSYSIPSTNPAIIYNISMLFTYCTLYYTITEEIFCIVFLFFQAHVFTCN